MKIKRRITSWLLVLVMLTVGLTACNKKTEQPTQPAVTVAPSQEESTVLDTAYETTESNTAETTTAEPTAEPTTEAPTEPKSPNLNPDMETMSVWDVVNQMTTGISIGNTLDAHNTGLSMAEKPARFEKSWGNPQITQELIDAILDSGMNVIRIPVTWYPHIGAAPEYTIDVRWMDRVQEVVDYVYNRGGFVILNIHHENWNDPYYATQDQICEEMTAVWSQIAERFKDYDEHLIFEGQNEPRKIGTNVEWTGGDKEGWAVVNATNKAFVDTIRSSGGSNPYRMLMVPSYAANAWNALKSWEIPNGDDRIILSVHAYEPYNFALNTKGTSKWNNDKSNINTIMNTLNKNYISKGIPVILGEYGAMNKDNLEDRVEWVKYYIGKATNSGVKCLWWDNGLTSGDGELFGLFNRSTYECDYPEILAGIMYGLENPVEK